MKKRTTTQIDVTLVSAGVIKLRVEKETQCHLMSWQIWISVFILHHLTAVRFAYMCMYTKYRKLNEHEIQLNASIQFFISTHTNVVFSLFSLTTRSKANVNWYHPFEWVAYVKRWTKYQWLRGVYCQYFSHIILSLPILPPFFICVRFPLCPFFSSITREMTLNNRIWLMSLLHVVIVVDVSLVAILWAF